MYFHSNGKSISSAVGKCVSKFAVKLHLLVIPINNHFFSKNLCSLPNYAYLCIGLGEKSRAADALAFISRLTENA